MEKPFESPPATPHSRRRGPAAGREGAGRANFKPPACPRLLAPRNRLCAQYRGRPFSRWRALSPLRLAALSPPQAALSGALGFRARTLGGHYHPHQPVHTERCGKGERVGGGAIPCSQP